MRNKEKISRINEKAKNLNLFIILGVGLLLVVSLISAGVFNIDNLRLSEESGEVELAGKLVNEEQTNELAEQTIPTSYDNQINIIDKNNIIENETRKNGN